MTPLIISICAAFLIFGIVSACLKEVKRQENDKKQQIRPKTKEQQQEEAERIRKQRQLDYKAYMEKIGKEIEDDPPPPPISPTPNTYDTMIPDWKAAIQPIPIFVSDRKSKKIAISFLNSLKYSTITVHSNMETLGDYVVIDTETTGLKCVSDEIIEIAAIRFHKFQPVEKFTTLLTSSKSIPKHITEINHITNEMVADKPCFQQIAPALLEFIGNNNLVGYNLPFDLKFIVHYGANVTVTPRKYYDVLDLARKTIRNLNDYQLLTVCVGVGIPGVTYKTLHRAEADALATGLLFKKIIDFRMERKRN